MRQANRFLRGVLFVCAWVCFLLGCVGVFVPVLPTTPFLLLAGVLFARSSERCYAWMRSTSVYRKYVASFKEAGGMTASAKVRMLALSYAVLAVSAVLVQRPFVWAILGCVAVFLLWLVTVRIPTISLGAAQKKPEPAEE